MKSERGPREKYREVGSGLGVNQTIDALEMLVKK
jgi:hypothetical protein